jgi:hypothetical protein
MTMSMRKGPCVGLYTLYTANWTIPGGMSFSSRIDIISGKERSTDIIVDDFNDAAELPGSCAPFVGPSTCETVTLAPPATTAATSTDVVLPSPTTTASPEPVPNDNHNSIKSGFRLGQTFAGFFQYLTNYVANFFFGYVNLQSVSLLEYFC